MMPSQIENMPVIMKIIKGTSERIEKITGTKVVLHIRLAYLKKPEDKKIILKQLIEREFNCPWHKIISTNRKRVLVDARQTYMYFSKHFLHQILSETAHDLGGRDHTTIIHGLQKIENMIYTQDYITEIINRISAELNHEPKIN